MEERVSPSSVGESSVLFEQRRAVGEHRIGIATLNAPHVLNGLSLEMTRLLDVQLRRWQNDATVVCVVLQGAGEKAFCAGGDLHGLYRSMLAFRAGDAQNIDDNRQAAAFFEEEYRLDYCIHRYAKPILCWGDGIVMGGGIGLMAGASHRVVTERSRLAFPEISIGLFPDVGGSWLLRRVPRQAGIFLGLTGAPLGASDAIYAGLADVCVASPRRAEVLDALCAHAWTADAEIDRKALSYLLAGFTCDPLAGPLQRHAGLLERVGMQATLEAAVADIDALDDDEPWLQAARATLRAGSPGSARLAWELQLSEHTRTLADTFRTEYTVALHCAAHGDFAEGIRALLVDKDRHPHWNPSLLARADAAWAQRFFETSWPARRHPLADLE